MSRAAIIRTAALAHWRHDFTGRATPRACNDNQLAARLSRAGEGGSASVHDCAAAIVFLAGMAVLFCLLHAVTYGI